jgi:hypothetical protein
MDKLRALYYPGSVMPDEELKACALYFDEIFVHDHMHVAKLDLEGLHTSPPNQIFDDPNAISQLFNQDTPAGYAHLYGEYSHLRFVERTRVLQDEGILIIGRGLGNAGVDSKDLFEERTLLRGLRKDEYVRIAARTFAYGYATPLFISNHFYEPLGHKDLRYVVRMILEFLFEAVFADSAEHSAVPITDDPIMKQQMEVFVTKFIQKRRRRSKPDPNIHGFNALRNRLPSLALRSYEDVLEARHKLNVELLEFREKVRELTNFICSEGLSGSAEEEARRIQLQIDSKVNAIERKIGRARRKFLRQLAEGIVLASPPALVTTLYPNMSMAALTLAFMAAAASKTLNAWEDYRDSREGLNDEPHGVSYLLKLKDVI